MARDGAIPTAPPATGLVELARRAAEYDAPLAQEVDGVGQRERPTHVLLDHEQRDAEVPPQEPGVDGAEHAELREAGEVSRGRE